MPRRRTPTPPPARALFIRGFTPTVADKIKSGSSARHMTLADYLTELVGLHEDLRTAADAGDRKALAMLSQRGLETVRA